MRRILITVGLMMMLSGLVATAQDAITCADTLPSRLQPDMVARVTVGSSNRVRNAPSTEGVYIGDIPGGGEFYVLNGPVCQDGFAWWYVASDTLVGWTVEGSDEYWLEPVNSTFIVPPIESSAETLTPFAFNGVTFDLSNQVAAGATGEIMPEVRPDAATFSLDVAPEHTLIEFEPKQDLYFPYLAIYPASAYEILKETSLDTLRDLLAQRPEVPELRGGPIVNAAQAFAVQPAYVDFVNGSGVRAIVHWTQAYNLLTDGGISYAYAGLTNDGEYLVHLVIPLDSDRLPHYLTVIGDNWDYEGFASVYPDYMTAAAQMVAALSSDSFTPTLETLDALVASLDVSQINQAVMVDSAGNECVAARPRLLVDEFARQALAQDSLRVRDVPGGTATANNVLPGQLVSVLSGPVCMDNVAWWQVSSTEGWSGWVAEGGQDNYFFDPITRTPLPTLTFTPTMTSTPRPIPTRGPTSTPSVSSCIVIPFQDTRLRVQPDVNSNQSGVAGRNSRYFAQAMYQRPGEDFPWWQLGARENATTNNWGITGSWLRADFVTEEGNCDALPVVTAP